MPARKKQWASFWSLLRNSKVPWLLIAVAFVLSIISAKAAVLFPDYSIKFFEEGNITRRTVLTGIGLLVFAAAVSVPKSYLEAWLRTCISMRLRDTVLEKVLHLKMSAVNSFNPRELISRISNDTGMLSDFIVSVFMVIAGEAFHFYFALSQIAEYSSRLLALQLLFIPVSLLMHWIQGSFSYRFQYGVQLRLSDLTEYLSERLVNIPLIKVFTGEKKEIQNGEDHIDEYSGMRIRFAMIDVVFVIIEDILRFSNRIAAILYGGYLVHKGVIDIGVWIAYYMLVEQASINLDIIAAQWPVLKSVQGAIVRTAEISEMDEEDFEGEEIKDIESGLSMRDYCLSIGDSEILKNIDADFEKNSRISIIGSSGSGKSTMLNALIRLYDASRGRLSIGDRNANDIALADYRRRFAYVFQDVRLFSGSLRYNLCYGADREIEDEEILRICDAAGLTGFIEGLPSGLDSEISEGGSNLSGGELQRIGIARALLRNPDIILLDEATSALDAETEQKVMDAVYDNTEGGIAIRVTHNMTGIEESDRIIVMEDGQIAAEGSHDELLANCETYRRYVADDAKEVSV